MSTVDVNYVTQNNSYVQLATLRVFQPLLRDLRQTSTERYVKPAVVRDFFVVRRCNCHWHCMIKTGLGSVRNHVAFFFRASNNYTINCNMPKGEI